MRTMPLSRPKLIAIIAAAALFGALLVVFRLQAEVARPPEKPDAAYWAARIAAVGGERAYEEFAESVRDVIFTQQHMRVHAFGAALYDVEGLDGLSVCDDRFSFGCFHEFLASAIVANGVESIPELNERCFSTYTKNPLSCQHGIGHGVLAVFGYDDVSLVRALETCRSLPGSNSIGGCYGGVFMEYNTRSRHADELRIRPYAGDPLAPCMALSEDFRAACIYWQPQWWAGVLYSGKPDTETYAQMGSFCRGLSGEALRRSCYEGIGNITFVYSHGDTAVARNFCDAAGEGSESGRLLCRATTANGFRIEASAEKAREVCEGFSDDEAEFCDIYARNEAHKYDRLDVP